MNVKVPAETVNFGKQEVRRRRPRKEWNARNGKRRIGRKE